jgi:hypothetical protein
MEFLPANKTRNKYERGRIYKLFKKSVINSELLLEISIVLQADFLNYILIFITIIQKKLKILFCIQNRYEIIKESKKTFVHLQKMMMKKTGGCAVKISIYNNKKQARFSGMT